MGKHICEGIEIKGDELIRYRFENLPPGQEDKIWDPDIIFELEKKHLEEKYFPHICEKYKLERNPNIIKWDNLKSQIERTYIEKDVKTEEIDRIKEDFYRKLCPLKGEIIAWLIAFILSVIGETVILLVQSIFAGGFNPMIFLFAFLLALGGWFVGKYLGVFFWISKLKILQMYTPSYKMGVSEYVSLIIGTILILFVALVRAVFGSEIESVVTYIFISWSTFYIFILTVILGLTVAFTEGMKIYKSRLRDECIIRQEKAAQYYASQQHQNMIDMYKQMFEEVKKKKGILEEESLNL